LSDKLTHLSLYRGLKSVYPAADLLIGLSTESETTNCPFIVLLADLFLTLRAYKSKLELKSNQLIASLSEFISFIFALKVRLNDLKFEFCQFKLK